LIKIGTDIVKVSRISKLGMQEKKKVFQPTEIDKNASSLAGIFAAKEAVKKALGTDIGWLDIEIRKNKNGKPTINLKNNKNIKEKELSIAHDGDYAIAVAVFVKPD
jgi:NAD(P)H-hydrate epimerase|tara:strand:- start:9475 stop:9792 length:318 start_codon:yes stop_codon:yes gene_type:complete